MGALSTKRSKLAKQLGTVWETSSRDARTHLIMIADCFKSDIIRSE